MKSGCCRASPRRFESSRSSERFDRLSLNLAAGCEATVKETHRFRLRDDSRRTLAFDRSRHTPWAVTGGRHTECACYFLPGADATASKKVPRQPTFFRDGLRRSLVLVGARYRPTPLIFRSSPGRIRARGAQRSSLSVRKSSEVCPLLGGKGQSSSREGRDDRDDRVGPRAGVATADVFPAARVAAGLF